MASIQPCMSRRIVSLGSRSVIARRWRRSDGVGAKLIKRSQSSMQYALEMRFMFSAAVIGSLYGCFFGGCSDEVSR